MEASTFEERCLPILWSVVGRGVRQDRDYVKPEKWLRDAVRRLDDPAISEDMFVVQGIEAIRRYHEKHRDAHPEDERTRKRIAQAIRWKVRSELGRIRESCGRRFLGFVGFTARGEVVGRVYCDRDGAGWSGYQPDAEIREGEIAVRTFATDDDAIGWLVSLGAAWPVRQMRHGVARLDDVLPQHGDDGPRDVASMLYDPSRPHASQLVASPNGPMSRDAQKNGARRKVVTLLEKLDPRSRALLRARFGIGTPALSPSEIAERFELTNMQASAAAKRQAVARAARRAIEQAAKVAGDEDGPDDEPGHQRGRRRHFWSLIEPEELSPLQKKVWKAHQKGKSVMQLAARHQMHPANVRWIIVCGRNLASKKKVRKPCHTASKTS